MMILPVFTKHEDYSSSACHFEILPDFLKFCHFEKVTKCSADVGEKQYQLKSSSARNYEILPAILRELPPLEFLF